MTSVDTLVRRHVAAFNDHDAERLLADFTPDATWVTGDHTVPRGELRPFFESAMSSLTPRLTLLRVIGDGQVVVAEMTETWSHENETKHAALVAVLDLVGGKIDKAKIYREGSAEA